LPDLALIALTTALVSNSDPAEAPAYVSLHGFVEDPPV